MKRPAALVRFPRLRLRHERRPLVSPADRARYPALAEDFATLDEILMEPFHRLDEAAAESQNTFLRSQVILIAGSAAAAIVGAVHTAVGGGDPWLGGGQALLTGGLTVLATVVARLQARARYVDQRQRAERLRSHYFLFLARAEPYASGDVLDTLRDEVDVTGGREGRHG
jgi:hypothetical protein